MLKILVIDDELQLLSNIASYLTSFGDEFEVLTAPSGEEGLEILESDPKIDVVLTDLRLPGIDGIEVIRRTVERWSRIRVIVMTAFGSPEIKSKALRNGALRFLEKPLDLDEVVTLMREMAVSDQGWSGSVLDLDIFDLAQLFLISGKTTAVRVTAGRTTGTLVFKAGALVHASTAEAQGVQAFSQMIGWEGGLFEEAADADPDSYPPNVDISTTHLMIEAARIRDEKGREVLPNSRCEGPEPVVPTTGSLDQPTQPSARNGSATGASQESVFPDTDSAPVAETNQPELRSEGLMEFLEDLAADHREPVRVPMGDVEVSQLLSRVCETQNSWRIVLRCGEKEAVVYVVHGAIAHAVLGATTGEEVLYSVVTWNNVEVELEAGVASPAQSVSPEYATLFLKAFA